MSESLAADDVTMGGLWWLKISDPRSEKLFKIDKISRSSQMSRCLDVSHRLPARRFSSDDLPD